MKHEGITDVYTAEVNTEEPTEEEVRDFPGTHPLSLEALVKRAHEGLGHPGKERFLRILAASKVSPRVMEIARGLRCSVCEKFTMPRPSRTAAPPREVGLNEIVGVDTILVKVPFSNKMRYCLNIIDYHSHFQMVVPLSGHSAEITRQGYRLWVRTFGPPKKVLVDLGKEFQQQFVEQTQREGTELVPSALETPEQRGFVERNGQLFKTMLYKVMEDWQVSTWDDWYEAVDSVCFMKNRLMSRGGYSPAQRVFGYNHRIPGGLMSDGAEDHGVHGRLHLGDQPVQRSMELRKLAAQAFHEVDCGQALRAAATAGPRPRLNYEVGQAVYFWRRGMNAARRPANTLWHGPARVVATQLPHTVWVAFNRHLVKAAPEKLRPASEEEFFSLSGWLEGISNAKKQFESEDLQGLIDLTKEEPLAGGTTLPDLPPLRDYWRETDEQWVRIHLEPRQTLYNPVEDEELPFDADEIEDQRLTIITDASGRRSTHEDRWHPKEYPAVVHPEEKWTGETRFIKKTSSAGHGAKRIGEGPLYRLHKKTCLSSPVTRASSSVAIEERPEISGPETVPLPEDAADGLTEPAPSEQMESSPEKRDREPSTLTPTGEWEVLPEAKRSRLELLDLYFQEAVRVDRSVPKKAKECSAKDFTGKDAERLQRAIQKEVNNNLGTAAYEILDPAASALARRTKGDLIMKSRYVITKKPIEEHAVEDARSADEVLDNPEMNGPAKAKCRHVMQGYSEANILDLETTTPQVHRDTVVFTAQVIVSNEWEAGFADFSQAFHSGDPIEREVYAEPPPEGLPGVRPGQLLKLLKTCYGLTDGPAAWFKHVVKLLTKTLGYRQSVVDPCLFYLDSTTGSSIDGIVAVATDDLLHGGNSRHREKMEEIKRRYKLGKYTFGSGRFVGKQFNRLADGSMMIEQSFYTSERIRPIEISKERKRRRFGRCSATEESDLRTLTGALAWLSKETRCDLAGKVALLQQCFPRPQVRDLIFANSVAKEALDHRDLGIHVMPIPWSRIRAGVVTDASWGNSRELGSTPEEESADYWTEQEKTWTRVHVGPRRTAFHPASAPHGPDLHDLLPERTTYVTRPQAGMAELSDTWTGKDGTRLIEDEPWCGTTVFYKQPEGQVLDANSINTAFDQMSKLYSQGGEIVFFYDQDLPKSQSLQNVTFNSWKSYRLKRRTVNTLSSETQALVRGMSSIHWLRVLILEARGLEMSAREWTREVASLPYICVTDSKSLYDMIQKCMNPASQCDDKRTSIDVALIKQELKDLNGVIRWIDGRTMLADSLTKVAKSDYLRHVMLPGRWSILEEGASLQKKLSERTEIHFLFPV